MDARTRFRSQSETALQAYFHTCTHLEFSRSDEPLVSIIVPVAGNPELVFQCLASIREQTDVPYELILADNSASKEMRTLLDSLHGCTVIENHGNMGFVKAVNRSAHKARGTYLLLLNDDTVILPGSLSALVDTAEHDRTIGAVGGKIVSHKGTLQEAGCIVWQDGSTQGYGRGCDPEEGEYNFRRDVDFCSGCVLLTPRRIFLDSGSFDEAFSPGYYEETDYCLRLWQNGYRVVYEPRSAVLHYEYGTSTKEHAVRLMNRNRPYFVEKHPELHEQFPPGTDPLAARSRGGLRGRVLILDDRVPHPYLGSGYPRAAEIVREIHRAGFFVTIYPLSENTLCADTWDTVYETLPREIEVVRPGKPRLKDFLKARSLFYDIILVSRPHNIKALLTECRNNEHLYTSAKLVYDAEAVYAVRRRRRQRIHRMPVHPREARKQLDAELELARPARLITTVSSQEAHYFTQYGYRNTAILGHKLSPNPTPNRFDARSGILFVGALHTEDSPNVDALVWFVHEVFPTLRSSLGNSVKLTVVGQTGASKVDTLTHPGVVILGQVLDLTALYNDHRLLIAPTRFAAGVPHKIHEAAARGVPVVATRLLAEQLGWRHRIELMVAHSAGEYAQCCADLYQDPVLWQRVRESALHRVAEDCSSDRFHEGIQAIVTLDWKLKGQQAQNAGDPHLSRSSKGH